MARGTGSSGGEKRATPRGTASDGSDQGYYVSLFLKTGYVRVGYESDELESGFTSPQDAIVRANAAVVEGPWVRAIVYQENDDDYDDDYDYDYDDAVVTLYDTAEEEEEEEEEELLLELIRDGIRCIWRGGTTISASNTDTGVDEIEITEPTAKCALTAMEAYYSANQRR